MQCHTDDHTDDHLLLVSTLTLVSSQHSAICPANPGPLRVCLRLVFPSATALQPYRPPCFVGPVRSHAAWGPLTCFLFPILPSEGSMSYFTLSFSFQHPFSPSSLSSLPSALPSSYVLFLSLFYLSVFARLAFPCGQRWLSANIPTIWMHSINFSCS